MKYNRLINNTIMQYIMTFAQYVFPLITFPYLTRVLEPELFGVVSYLTATITFFQIFIDYGFNLSSTRDISLSRNDNDKISNILGNTIQAKIILILFCLVFFSITVFTLPILRDHFLLSYLYLGTVILSILLPDYLFRGIERMAIITNRFLISKTITTLLTFLLVQNKEDVLWVPILNIVGSIIAIILTWYHIIYKLKIKVQFTSLRNVFFTIRTSTIYFISNFATTAFGAINTLMLGIMNIPLSEVAFWSVSYNLVGIAQSLYSPIVNSLYPHMVAKKDIRLVKKILLIFMPLILLTLILVWFFTDTLMLIVAGKQYIEASSIFRMLLPVLLLSFPAMLIGFPVLGAVGKVNEVTTTTIISACFHIIGLLILATTGYFTLINIAILRSLTELILLSTRLFYLRNFFKKGRVSSMVGDENA